MSVSRGRVRAWLDGRAAPQIDGVDPSPLPNGRIGLGGWSDVEFGPAFFDDVLVTTP